VQYTDVAIVGGGLIPQWLATEGMDTRKIAAFYGDPEKTACEARCLAQAYHLRSLSIDNGLSWRAQRAARFVAACPLANRDLSATDWPPDQFRNNRLRNPVTGKSPDRLFAISGSILVVIIVIIAGLIVRLMRLVALVVPQLAIDPVGGEQFLV